MSSASDFLCPHCGLEMSTDGLEPNEVYGCPSCEGEFSLPSTPAARPAPQSGLPPRKRPPPRNAPPRDAPAAPQAPDSMGFPPINTGAGVGPQIRTERTSASSRASSYAARDRNSNAGQFIMIRLIIIGAGFLLAIIAAAIKMNQ